MLLNDYTFFFFFALQGEENQMVDPRVIHVMLTEEEVGLFY